MNERYIEKASNFLKILSKERKMGKQETKDFYDCYLKYIMSINDIDLNSFDVRLKFNKNLNDGYFNFAVGAYIDMLVYKNDPNPHFVINIDDKLSTIKSKTEVVDLFYSLMDMGHEMHHVVEYIYEYNLQISKEIAQIKLNNVEKNLISRAITNREKKKINKFIIGQDTYINSNSKFEVEADHYGIAYGCNFLEEIKRFANDEELNSFINLNLYYANLYEKEREQARYKLKKEHEKRIKKVIKKYGIHPNNLYIDKN